MKKIFKAVLIILISCLIFLFCSKEHLKPGEISLLQISTFISDFNGGHLSNRPSLFSETKSLLFMAEDCIDPGFLFIFPNEKIADKNTFRFEVKGTNYGGK